MDLNKARFLPFTAINEFMRDDYRRSVISETLIQLGSLPKPKQAALESQTRKAVNVPGFRNSAKAPLMLRIKGLEEAFTRSAPLVAAIIDAWSELHSPLRLQVHTLLSERGWPVYPPESDRTHLPGFHITWPKSEDFEVIVAAFAEKYPDAPAADDDVSLMTVWMSMRLPYALEEEDQDEQAPGPATDAALAS